MAETHLPFLTHLASLSDTISMRYFRSTSMETKEKHDKTMVSQADLAIEEAIKTAVHAQHPDWGILGEEYGSSQDQSPIRLIIDPIDSTQNFIRGLPWFATLLAIESHGEIVAGLVSAPYYQERWWAEKGQGSFYNGQKISVSGISKLNEAQAFHGSLYGAECKEMPSQFLPLMSKTHRQRGLGDYLSHMMVAMGCGEFAIDFGVKPWDIAPFKIIVEEAGGKVTNFDGKFSPYVSNIVASNGFVHETVLTLVREN